MIRAITVCGFALCGLAAAALYVQGRRKPEQFAPLGDLLDEAMNTRSARVAIVLFWWWLGWHFLVADVAAAH